MAGSDINSAPSAVLVGDEEKGLHRTTTAVTMSPEMFERVSLCSAHSSFEL